MNRQQQAWTQHDQRTGQSTPQIHHPQLVNTTLSCSATTSLITLSRPHLHRQLTNQHPNTNQSIRGQRASTSTTTPQIANGSSGSNSNQTNNNSWLLVGCVVAQASNQQRLAPACKDSHTTCEDHATTANTTNQRTAASRDPARPGHEQTHQRNVYTLKRFRVYLGVEGYRVLGFRVGFRV